MIKLISIYLGFILYNGYTFGQDSNWQIFGIQYKYNLSSESKYSKMNKSEIYGNGLYSFSEFHSPNLSIVNSMFITTDSVEAVKGSHKGIKGILVILTKHI